MEQHRRRRARRMAGTTAGVLALATLAAPAAEAALHGPPVSFTTRPALRAVTFNGRVASFTFDRAVTASSAFTADGFAVGGYRAGAVQRRTENTTAVVAISDPRTVLLTYSGATPDFGASTFGSVQGGMLVGRDAPHLPALGDSAPLSGSLAESGTRGHSAGPELQTVGLDVENNTLTYVFDQAVDAGRVTTKNFGYGTVGAEVVTGSSIALIDGASVTVNFDGRDLASAARRAIVTGPIFAEDGTPGPPAWSVPIPGHSTTSVAPTLTSAVRAEDGSFTLTFDQPINGIVDPAKIHAVLSDGSRVEPTGKVFESPNIVRAFFVGTLDGRIEHLIGWSVDAGAVTGTGAQQGFPTGVPFGGNSGARATGYTTAPDAFAAEVNAAAGQVSVVFDSRLAGTPSASTYTLLKADGSPVGAAASGIRLIQNAGPSQARVVLQYTPAQVAATAAIQLTGNVAGAGGLNTTPGRAAAFGTLAGSPADAQSLETLFSPSATTLVY